MKHQLSQAYGIIFSSAILLLSTLPSMAACVSGPGDCPETPCADIESATEIEGELNKDSDEAMQCCKNPDGSSSWDGEDWANHFQVHISFMQDRDVKTPKKYVMVMDGEGNCSWDLRNDDPREVGDQIEFQWSGGVDMTEPGAYELECLLYNPEVRYDENGCPENELDDPLTLTFTLTVQEAQPQQEPLPDLPSPGWEPWHYEDPYDPNNFDYYGFTEDGTIVWYYCYKFLTSSGGNVCGADALISMSQTTQVEAHAQISAELASISALIGASLQTAETVNRQFGPCGGDSCRFHKVNVYQRAIKTTRYVACAEHIGIFCDTVPAGQQDITEYLYEDSNTIEGRCENYVTKLPGAPGCLCQDS